MAIISKLLFHIESLIKSYACSVDNFEVNKGMSQIFGSDL